MIAVYNETDTKWKFEKDKPKVERKRKGSKKKNEKSSGYLNGSFVRTSLTKETKYGIVQGEFGEIKLPVSKLFKSSINLKKLKTSREADKRRRPVTISREKVTTILSKERMDRVLLPSTIEKYTNSLLFLTLDKNSILGNMRVKYNKATILDVFNVDAELSAVIGFPNYGDNLTFMYQKKDGTYESKMFIYQSKGDKEFIDVIIKPITSEEYLTGFDKFKRYIPYIPSFAVIAHDSELGKAKNMKGHHEFFTYTTEESLDKLIDELKAKKYDAITIFTDTEFRNESEEEREKYSSVIDKLRARFNIVIKGHKNGFVDRVQTHIRVKRVK